ncbi:response regulator [Legionella shakespearei]|uniref:Response regulatory domain-containing protein n=1 Tax=Legionella shakespearei DSM 23087 TaxID=1122169 RepID=A0A0W0ZEA0_9GAMM|nr:response regulator [Legionella shakespearei]KTD67489.1 hypothetical protein Lsha_0020 [Legionella shakespearei DSM 23087]
METHIQRPKARILLIDDNPISIELILDLSPHISFQITLIDNLEKLGQLRLTKPYDLILINQATLLQNKYNKIFEQDKNVICYTTVALLNDYMRASSKTGKDTLDKSWVLRSDLYKLMKQFI